MSNVQSAKFLTQLVFIVGFRSVEYIIWPLQYLLWMRSSCVRTSNFQCQSRSSPSFDLNILWHSRIWGAADEAVLNKVHKKLQHSPGGIFTVPLVTIRTKYFTLILTKMKYLLIIKSKKFKWNKELSFFNFS